MSSPTSDIDFATVLGAAVHDMKNSLCLLRQSIEDLGRVVPKGNTSATDMLASAHYEASRLNTGLVQLLSLYRAETENLPIHVDECFVEDLVDELRVNNQSYLEHKNLKLEIEQRYDGPWYCDADLIYLLVNDVLVNAMRYCQSCIKLSVLEEDGKLLLRVEDDGEGYPNRMLEAQTVRMAEFDIHQGRTGLGLFFARMIAEAHANGDERGRITLSNGGSLGGSVFTLILP